MPNLAHTDIIIFIFMFMFLPRHNHLYNIFSLKHVIFVYPNNFAFSFIIFCKHLTAKYSCCCLLVHVTLNANFKISFAKLYDIIILSHDYIYFFFLSPYALFKNVFVCVCELFNIFDFFFSSESNGKMLKEIYAICFIFIFFYYNVIIILLICILKGLLPKGVNI